MKILLSLAIAAAALTAHSRAQELKTALEAFQSGDYERAVELALAVGENSPDRAKALFLCGEAQLLLGDGAPAESAFRKVLLLRPGSLPAQVGLGRALAAQKKNAEAEKVLRAAVQADPKDAPAKRALGELLVATERVPEGIAQLEEARKLTPKDALLARALFDAYLATGAEDKATKLAAALARQLPKHPMGPFLQGIALERAGKDEKAIDAYREALARDETFLDAHKNLAIVCHTRNPLYSDMQRTQMALDHYQRYFELGGKDEELERLYSTMKKFLEAYGMK